MDSKTSFGGVVGGTMDPEEGFLDTSIPDLSLKAFKASKKGNNPDLPNFREEWKRNIEKSSNWQ